MDGGRAGERGGASRSGLAECIAERSGYDSEAAFSRAFKREFGAPPAAWKKHAST